MKNDLPEYVLQCVPNRLFDARKHIKNFNNQRAHIKFFICATEFASNDFAI